jgi:hypothetical protein
MTAIVQRSVDVAHLEDTAGLEAAYPYPEDAADVQLTASLLRAAGGQPLQPGVDWACRLQLRTLDEAGLTDGIGLYATAAYGTVEVTFTGTAETEIPAGTTVEKGDGILWATDEDTEIPAGQTTVAVTVVCCEPGVIAALAASLDTISPAVAGLSAVTNALAAVPGAAVDRSVELRLYDQRTHGLVSLRSSLVETVPASGVYQITPAPNQRSLLDDDPGDAGELVIRWDASETAPPPIGLWDWILTLVYPSGPVTVAEGTIEVVP